jgi:hypothetical protein
MIAKLQKNVPALQALLKLQCAMALIAGLVIYFFEARTFGKILAVVILFAVLSVIAFVHLQLRYERPASARVRHSRAR